MKICYRIFATLSVLLVAAGISSGIAFAQDEPKRSITHVAGDLYRFQNNFHYAVYLVTPEGIVVTDPINAETATWLKGELATRHPGIAVKYLLFSHNHPDHISGGEVFADTATVVAHERAKAAIVANNHPTAIPDETFTDRKTITIGDKSVELIFLGPNHSDDLVVMRFMPERVVFAVDMVGVTRVPWRDLPGGDLEGWIESLKRPEALDFDILATAHGPMGMVYDVADHRAYFEDLRFAVGRAIDNGHSLEEIKQIVTMDKYSHWLQFDNWGPMNIEGMHRMLTE